MIPYPRRVSCWLLALGLSSLAACNRSADEGVSGTIELVETDVAPLVPARVLQVRIEEGDTVHQGDTLATLMQSTLPADIDQRRARVAAAEAELRDLLAGARPAEIDRAEAELRSAETESARLQRDAERFVALAAAGQISQAELERAQAGARVAASRRDATREALRLLREGARTDRVSAARAAVASARAQLAMAEASAADLVLLAPVSGVVLTRAAEPGEVIPAGVPVVTLGNPARLWVRVYVNTPMLANIKVGGQAEIHVPGVEQPVAGTVASINTRAEFTPRVALTEDEREDLLFGVKVTLADTLGVVKPGLPVTVTFPQRVARDGTSRE